MAKGTDKTPGSTIINAQPGGSKTSGKPASPDAGKAGVKIGQAEMPGGGKSK